MHVSLSDLLVCPACGPEWGLVLMPGSLRQRRVEAGALGCPNCRSRFEIRDGVARLATGETFDAGGAWRPGDGAVRIAALLGLGDRRGAVVLAGPASAHGPALAELVEGVEIVVLEPPAATDAGGPGAAGADGRGAGASRLEVGAFIPLRTGGTSGVALTGGATALAAEAARVLGPGARLLVDPADEAVRAALSAAGLRVLAKEGEAVLAGR